MKITDASRPQTEEGMQYHIQCKKGDVSRYVLMPGDPERVNKISAFFDGAKTIADHREYRTHTGAVGGTKISATSSGIGGPALSIALEELATVGADTFIRVGTCGAIQKKIRPGDLVISSAAVRMNDASLDYVRLGYPAASSYEVTLALVEACEKLNAPYHVGVTASTNTFFCGQSRPGFGGFKQSWTDDIIEDLRRARVLNFEMEAATLFTMCGLFGLRAGAICAAVANRETNEFADPGVYEVSESNAAKAAVEAVKILSGWDAQKEKHNKKFWFPSLLQ